VLNNEKHSEVVIHTAEHVREFLRQDLSSMLSSYCYRMEPRALIIGNQITGTQMISILVTTSTGMQAAPYIDNLTLT
jgi:hypothetical protein